MTTDHLSTDRQRSALPTAAIPQCHALPTAATGQRCALPTVGVPQRRTLPAAATAGIIGSLLFLSACGGDNDTTLPPPPPPPPPPAPTVTLTGVVLDGPLQTAKVCLDLNDNRICDAAEPTATTTATGTYSLTALQSDAPNHALLAEAAAGTTIDADFGVVPAAFTLVAPAGKGAVISPFTTLVQSEVDSGRAANFVQAEETLITNLVGTAGDVGGLTLYSNYLPDSTDATALATRRAKMYGLAQLLSKSFAQTRTARALTGKALVGAYGQAAAGSLQQVLSQVAGKLTLESRDALAAALDESLVPSAANLAGAAAAAAKTAAAPIEGAWVRTTGTGTATVKELYLFAGDGTFVHQTIQPGVASTVSTVFDNGFGYRYGRYTLTAGALTTTLIEASEAAGPTAGTLTDVTITGNTLTAAGGLTLTRVTSTTQPLVGGWVRPNGTAEPEYLVLFDDGSYVHSSFYYQNDPQTGAATFFETAKSAGLRKGVYATDTTNTKLVTFGAATVAFNGNLTIPSDPGVGVLEADGSLSMTGLRMVKLGTVDGAKAVTGFSEATRARLWSGRYFSRNVTVAGATRLQYVYVRGPNDVLSFLQAPTGTSTTDQALTCGSTAATTVATPDFRSVNPADGKLKQFVVGTSTAATAGYAQRRLNVGLPGTGNFVTYTPIARPTNATARCVVPV